MIKLVAKRVSPGFSSMSSEWDLKRRRTKSWLFTNCTILVHFLNKLEKNGISKENIVDTLIQMWKQLNPLKRKQYETVYAKNIEKYQRKLCDVEKAS